MAKKINLGKVGITLEGNYDSSKSYASRTCVFYNHVSWTSKKDVPAGIAPGSNDEYWQKVSERGAQGERGPQGNSAYINDGEVNKFELVNNLTQGGEAAALSAEQGKILKTEITELESNVGDLSLDTHPFISETDIKNSDWFVPVALKKGETYIFKYDAESVGSFLDVYIYDINNNYTSIGSIVLKGQERTFVTDRTVVKIGGSSNHADGKAIITISKTNDLSERVRDLESNFSNLESNVEELESNVEELESNVEELESNVGNTLTGVCETLGEIPEKSFDNEYVKFSPNNRNCNVRLRIRMRHKNTSKSGVTLNINNTGAKILYYNYAPVTDVNTWDDYEDLDVILNGYYNRYEAIPFLTRTNEVADDNTKVPTSKAVAAFVKSSEEELKTIIKQSYTMPTIPKTGYGSLILSSADETYTHRPCMISCQSNLFVAYHAAKTGLGESPQDNRDYIQLVRLNNRHPNETERKVVAADLASDGFQVNYNGYTATTIYNQSMWLVGVRGYIKFCGRINGVPHWFYDTFLADAPLDGYYNPNPRPMKLVMAHTGEVLDFSLENYLKLMNALYATPLPSKYDAYAMDIADVIPYNGKHYMIMTAHTLEYGISKHPFMMLESADNGVTWSIKAKIDDNYADEVSMYIDDNGKAFILFRDYRPMEGNKEVGGVWFQTCDINGANKTEPLLVSETMSLPNVFKWNGKVYGCYNISSSVVNTARVKVQISELNEDGTINPIKTITSYSGLAYSNIIPYRNGKVLYFATAEMNAGDMYTNDIALSQLDLGLE